ncbi:MAG: hypothetical protein Q9N67_08740 [Ghiorsea sp.]|nr:hypothetical protein [Ghiorsea sp.]
MGTRKIQTFNLNADGAVAHVRREYFISTDSGDCITDIYGAQLSKTALPIDGYTAW